MMVQGAHRRIATGRNVGSRKRFGERGSACCQQGNQRCDPQNLFRDVWQLHDTYTIRRLNGPINHSESIEDCPP